MKALISFIFLLIAIPILSPAQQRMQDQKKRNDQANNLADNGRTPEERAAKLTTSLGEKLNLTDKQKDLIYEISLRDVKRFEEEQKRLRKKSDKPVFESSDASILEVLTDRQKEKYKKLDARKDAERNHAKEENDLLKKEPRQKRTTLN
jgi:lipopolysaccharide export LptBFGC system permease protein LptF